MTSSRPRHVIFGTGAVGLATLDALVARGETARMVNRSGRAPVAVDVEVVGGDAADPAFTTAVAAGAQVVYQTLNPPYHEWEQRSLPSRPASSPPRRRTARGWSPWRTSTCTGARTAGP